MPFRPATPVNVLASGAAPAGRRRMAAALAAMLFVCAPTGGHAQTTGALQGRVMDDSGAAIAGATIAVGGAAAGLARSVAADGEGRYHVVDLPPGTYQVTAGAGGFRSESIEGLVFEVGRTLVRDFRLAVGNSAETVVVSAEFPLLDRAGSTVGHVVSRQTIQEIPLNGRHFIDLGLLVPGSVAPSQTGFSTTPIRGTGALAFNSAGNREESVGYVVNGVTTNNLTFGSLGFSPPLGSIQEFKVDNSVFSAEYGHVSGAIVNLVTRAGGDRFHGAAHEFFRDEALDARNFFEFTSAEPHPFERHQFGGTLGGPVARGRTFFLATYEGQRQRQGLDLNSLVLSDEQREQASDAAVRRLIPLIPRANSFTANGTPRFVGSADAAVDEHTWSLDLRHNAGGSDRLQVFVGSQHLDALEPGSLGTTIPGFGHTRTNVKAVLTVSGTHVFGPGLVNEARFGRSTQDGSTLPKTRLNPAEMGIGNGVDQPLGLPQLTVAGGLSFGGPATYPQGRTDALYVFNDTLTYAAGRHAIRAGGEYRRFLNQNVAQGTGAFNFPSVAAFLAGTANAFSITLGERRSRITQDGLAFFVQDQLTLSPGLTLDLGLRYEWHVTPTERDDQFVVFDAPSASLLRVGVDVDEVHRQNANNVEPRLGIAWTPGADGRTVVRAAYGWSVDQPATTAVRDTAGNPPFAVPLTASGAIPLASATAMTQPVGLSPVTVDPGFRNASLRAWNVNVQRELASDVALMVGYFGSNGSRLRLSRNLNQRVAGVRPFPAVSAASPISPGRALGDITQVESTGFSSYHALWLAARKRLSAGLLVDTSYTWSKSLDTNSLNSSGFGIQDGYDIPNQQGLSDFDARQRVVLSATYGLPLGGHAIARDWQVALIVQAQSGNPLNIVTANSTLNGVPNTVRPDVTGPIRVPGSVDQWFDPSVFVPAAGFGNLGRNVVIGPAFHNTDLAVTKTVALPGRGRLQLRADVFDLFNHANFGPPGPIIGTPNAGRITRTRLPTGEAGSSRQIQLAVKVSY
jgi:hypothetical protein